MRIRDTFDIAYHSIIAHRLRSVLTILGIVIGIASVILMLSLGKGAETLILGQVASFGAKTIFVEPGSGERHGPPIGIDLTILKYRDVEALKRLPSLDRVNGMVWRELRVLYQDQDKKLQIAGELPDGLEISGSKQMRLGRYIEDTDVRSRTRVAVIGAKLHEDFFSNADPLNKEIRIMNQRFRVIGVLEERGTQFFQNLDERIYVPLPTLQDMLGVNYLNFITARAIVPHEIAMDDVRKALRDVHGIHNPDNDLSKDPFFVSSQTEAADIVSTITLALTLLLSSIAAVSLVVGGIGIMNIMLVSVTERTREIGLRKAVGARERDILMQFLVEAVLLTLSGGIIGIILGSGFSFVAYLIASNFVTGWEFTVPPAAILLAFSVATAVGLAFGIYPARRAAKLNPIEALRYE